MRRSASRDPGVPGVPKLCTWRLERPAPRSSTGTSSRAIRWLGTGRVAGDSATATRPDPVSTALAAHDRESTSVGPAKTDARPSRAVTRSSPSASRCRTAKDPASGTTMRSTPDAASSSASPSASTATRRPVCSQSGRDPSTTVSQPSRPRLPRGCSHSSVVMRVSFVVIVIGCPAGRAVVRISSAGSRGRRRRATGRASGW